MNHIEFTISVQIDTTPWTAYGHLADPANHPGLQPLVVETRLLKQGRNAQGHQTKRFYSIEQIRFLGLVPCKNKIEVLMTLLPEQCTILHETHRFPNIYLRRETLFEPTDNATAVTASVTIDCPDLLMGYVRKTAVAAHETLLQNLKTRLETEISA